MVRLFGVNARRIIKKCEFVAIELSARFVKVSTRNQILLRCKPQNILVSSLHSKAADAVWLVVGILTSMFLAVPSIGAELE